MRVTVPRGWGRRPEVDAPGPRPCWGARQLYRSHPQFVTRHRLPLNQAQKLIRPNPVDIRQFRLEKPVRCPLSVASGPLQNALALACLPGVPCRTVPNRSGLPGHIFGGGALRSGGRRGRRTPPNGRPVDRGINPFLRILHPSRPTSVVVGVRENLPPGPWDASDLCAILDF